MVPYKKATSSQAHLEPCAESQVDVHEDKKERRHCRRSRKTQPHRHANHCSSDCREPGDHEQKSVAGVEVRGHEQARNDGDKIGNGASAQRKALKRCLPAKRRQAKVASRVIHSTSRPYGRLKTWPSSTLW